MWGKIQSIYVDRVSPGMIRNPPKRKIVSEGSEDWEPSRNRPKVVVPFQLLIFNTYCSNPSWISPILETLSRPFSQCDQLREYVHNLGWGVHTCQWSPALSGLSGICSRAIKAQADRSSGANYQKKIIFQAPDDVGKWCCEYLVSLN